MKSRMRVKEQDMATVFYIPTFTACWRSQRKERREGGQRAGYLLRETVLRALKDAPPLLKDGRKHFWVSTHDMGKLEPVFYANHSLTASLALNGSVLVNTAEKDEYLKTIGQHRKYNKKYVSMRPKTCLWHAMLPI
eukprot:UC4_evm1s1044